MNNGKQIICNWSTILFSLSLAFFFFLLKWLENHFMLFNLSSETYITFITVIFTALGIWLALMLAKPGVERIVMKRKVSVCSGENFDLNSSSILQPELSKREAEILNLIALEHSFHAVASKFFVSVSTNKIHNQHLFEKLVVKGRMQAVGKAKKLNLTP